MTQTLLVEAAFGAVLTASPGSWTWTDITRYVRGSISVSRGRQDWLSQTQATRCSFRLANSGPNPGDDGRFTPRLPTSPLSPNVRRNLPIRVSLNGVVRAFVYADELAPVWLSPDVAEVNVTASGILRRLGKGQAPVRSALRRAITAGAARPRAYWSCEDPSGAALLTEEFGGAPMTFNGPVTLGSGGPPGSAGAVTVGDNVDLRAATTPGVGRPWIETAWSVQVCVNIAQAPASTTVVHRWETFSTAAVGPFNPVWAVSVQPGSPGNLLLQSFNADGSVGGINLSVPFTVNGAAPYGRDLLITVTCQGPGMSVTGSCADILTGTTLTMSGSASVAIGSVSAVIVPAALRPGGWKYSHVAVWATSITPSTYLRPAQAWDGEPVRDRLERLCGENSIPFSAPAATSVAMGPQRGNNLLTLLRECEAADQGILYDGLTAGLAYLPSDSRYNQPATMTLDNNRGQIKTLFTPVEDDQRVRNDWTASRPSGGTARQVNQAHIDANGLYDDSATVNVQTDAQLVDQAGWRLNLGTVEEMRIPALQIMPSHSTELQTPWLAMDLGERFDALNLPAEYPPGPYQAVLEGYSESFDAVVWSAQLNSSPFAPWRVFQLAAETGDTSEFVGRLDTDGSTLAVAVTAQPQGTVEPWQLTSIGAPWTTLADDFPFDLAIEGEQVRVTKVVNYLNANPFFEAPLNASSWTGVNGATVTAPGATFHEGAQSLLITPDGLTAVPRAQSEEMAVVGNRSYTLSGWLRSAVNATRTLGVSWYNASHTLLSSNEISQSVTAGAWTQYGPTSFTAPASAAFARIYSSDPGTPAASATWRLDEAMLVDPTTQVATVTRAVNGISKAHSAGAAVNLYQPLVLAL